MALSGSSNELILFYILPNKKECQVAARMPLSMTDDESDKYDSLQLFGPLIVARSTNDASLHMFLSQTDDFQGFMTRGSTNPAIFKLP